MDNQEKTRTLRKSLYLLRFKVCLHKTVSGYDVKLRHYPRHSGIQS